MKQTTKRRLWTGSVVLVVVTVVAALSPSGIGDNHHEFAAFRQGADGIKAVFRLENRREVEMVAVATISADGSESSSSKPSPNGCVILLKPLSAAVREFEFIGAYPSELVNVPIPSGLSNVVVSLVVQEDKLADQNQPRAWTEGKVWLHSWLEKRGATNLAFNLKWKTTTLVSPRR